MGTPGDRFPLGKIVHCESASENVHQNVTETANILEQSQSEMTILRDIPSLGIFLEQQGNPDRSIFEPEALKAVHVPNVQDFEKRLVHDTPNVCQSLTYCSDAVKSTSTQKPYGVMQELSLPGPSGLQTPKTIKQVTSVVKVAPKRSKKPPTSSQTPKKPHTCSICNKNFQNVSKLVSHQSTHSGGTPFKCEHCKKSFSSKFKLVRHVLIHSDRKPFSCTVCERTFHRKDHLKNHVKVHSPSKKIYMCEKANCKKEYTSVMSYRKHLALHSAEEGGLECKICLKTFETKAEILYHLKIHAGSRTVKNPNEKKFTCDYCERKFFTRKDVRRHLVVHTGTRNFLCQFCPQRFGRKDHLVRHIKKSHSTGYSESETADPSQSTIEDYQSVKKELQTAVEPVDNVRIVHESIEIKQELPISPKIQPVESILYSQRFTDLAPILCSNSEALQYLPHASETSKLDLLPESRMSSDNEYLTELVVMKEELEQQLGAHDASDQAVGILSVPHDIQDLHSTSLLSTDMIDTDLLRFINEGSSQLSTEEDNSLPSFKLPGFSQAFQQQQQQPP